MNTKITLLPQIQDDLIEIGQLLLLLKQLPSSKPSLRLRKESKVRTIFATTKIEGNLLTYDEVTALIEGIKISGKKKDVIEVKNAIKLYDLLPTFDCHSEQDYLTAHKVLMSNLIIASGEYRKVNVGIKSKDTNKIRMVFPEHEKIKNLCSMMFDYISNSKDNFLIKSCIIHYLSVSIHPFEDGNGRISRFWQSLYLSKAHPIFMVIPIESFIKLRQQDYYDYLNISQKADDPTGFVFFMLSLIKISLQESLKYDFEPSEYNRQEGRLLIARDHFKSLLFSRGDYLELHPHLSVSMATKDLSSAVNNGILSRVGDKSKAKYRF